MPLKRLALLAAVLAALLAASACGGDDSSASSPSATGASTTTAAAAEPVDGPQRIVSLSASLTEMLYAIGAGDQVVAVDQYSDHPAGTPITDLSGFSPNVEAIAGYQPDLVVASRDRDGLVDALEALDIPTLVLPSADSLAAVYDEIEQLGDATGRAEEAADLVEELRSDLAELAATVPDREAPLRYFYELSDDLSTVTTDTFIGEVLSLAGLVSIADGVDPAAGGFPQLSNEYVLDADPDVVFLAHTDGTGQDPAEVAGRPGWDGLRAVRDGAVVVLDADISSRWGPRIVDLLRAVIEATTT